MKLSLNKEYATRHLFVALLMAGLGCWFGYDGLVRYPATEAAELYRSIEKSDAPEGFDLEAFKRQKTETQYGFSIISLLVAAIVGARLKRSAGFRFEYDETSFTCNGKRHERGEIVAVDRTKLAEKSIATIKLSDGSKIVLDAWHHLGVKEFLATVNN